mgnify:CR=1 FL=1
MPDNNRVNDSSFNNDNPTSKDEVDTLTSHNPISNTVKSVAAAFFGVQSNKNREHDFSQGKLSHFIIVGVLGVVLFIGVLIAVVSLVLP